MNRTWDAPLEELTVSVHLEASLWLEMGGEKRAEF